VFDSAGPTKAFINIGGSDVNFGTDPALLKLKPGLVYPQSVPQAQNPMPSASDSLIRYYLSQGTPVIHFLNIKGLALQSGIPIDADPREPLPKSLISTHHRPAWPLVLSLILAILALAI